MGAVDVEFNFVCGYVEGTARGAVLLLTVAEVVDEAVSAWRRPVNLYCCK
jgi:hypothetical protein